MDSSGSSKSGSTLKSLSTIERFDHSSLRRVISYCTSTTNTLNSKICGSEVPSLSPQSAQVPLLSRFKDPDLSLPLPAKSIILAPALSPTANVPTNTSVWSVGVADTSGAIQTAKEIKEREAKGRRKLRDTHPRYARDFLWEENWQPTFSTSVDLSCDPTFATPVPHPPPCSAFCPEFLTTLDANPSLFKIVTPVTVNHLEYLLTDHPNRPFVESDLRNMHEEIWPWASLPPNSYPMINDQSQNNDLIRRYTEKLNCFDQECEKELTAGRFSQPFPSLLPGMSCMPMYVIERKGKH